MSENNEGCGGTVSFVLLIMIVLAAFGLINWATVGTFVRGVIYFLLAGFTVLFILNYFSKK